MNKDISLVYFGTSDRSTPILESLNTNFKLDLIVTKVPQKVGRHQELKISEVRVWAERNNIAYLEISNFRKECAIVLQRLQEKNIKTGIVADFSFIIPKEAITYFEKKLINIHFSLLPKYRGACPVQFAILNKDTEIGISYQLLSEKMDEGDLIGQTKHSIKDSDNTETLYGRLFNEAALELPKIMENYLGGTITPLPQKNNEVSYTYSRTNPKTTLIEKEDAFIDFTEKAEDVYAKTKAYYPWPIAWTTVEALEKATYLNETITFRKGIDKKLRIKLYKTHLIQDKVLVSEIQIEGKNRTNWTDFKNSYLLI